MLVTILRKKKLVHGNKKHIEKVHIFFQVYNVICSNSNMGYTVLRKFALRRINAVIFDMDGTLCLPQPWMFPAMREAIGLRDTSKDILEFIDEMEDPQSQIDAENGLKMVEKKAMDDMVPQPGLTEIMGYLTKSKISKNICTRNVGGPVEYLINKFIPEDYSKFDHIVTRDFRPAKPFPDPLLHIAQQVETEPESVIMVGDSFDDMKSGRSAGCLTVLLKGTANDKVVANHKDLIDFIINDLRELIEIIEEINAQT
ncbi:putative haloacid dehalogenase-like hydrolase [Nakaseomyces bracarensis]|uniref:putative haloacid dehalogenase-like hydrolase n=1 Tax=Nakaseomyces bracarensis TaxID=273131 RepID=UPI0038722477